MKTTLPITLHPVINRKLLIRKERSPFRFILAMLSGKVSISNINTICDWCFPWSCPVTTYIPRFRGWKRLQKTQICSIECTLGRVWDEDQYKTFASNAILICGTRTFSLELCGIRLAILRVRVGILRRKENLRNYPKTSTIYRQFWGNSELNFVGRRK